MQLQETLHLHEPVDTEDVEIEQQEIKDKTECQLYLLEFETGLGASFYL